MANTTDTTSSTPVHPTTFLTIPLEISAWILRLCVSEHWKDKYASLHNDTDKDIRYTTSLVLAQVCRHFRSLALKIPQLWTLISSRQSDEERTMYLERSKGALLRIHLHLLGDDDANMMDITHFFDAVVPHSNRWVEFHVRTGRSMTDYIWRFRKMARTYSGLHLPELSHMYVWYPKQDCWETDESEGQLSNFLRNKGLDEKSGFHFYRFWTTPKLKYLKSKSVFPAKCAGGSLESLCVNLTDALFSGSNEIHGGQFLSKGFAPTLRSLSIRSVQEISELDGEIVLLPILEDLQLDIAYHMMATLRIFIMPRLFSIEASFEQQCVVRDGTPSYAYWIRHGFNSANKFESLRVLRVRFAEGGEFSLEGFDDIMAEERKDPFDSKEHVLNTIFERFPSVNDLAISIPDGFNETPLRPFTIVPPLHSLRIIRTPHLTFKDICAVISALKESGRWDYFESLGIRECEHLSGRDVVDLEGLMAEKSLVWDADVDNLSSNSVEIIVEEEWPKYDEETIGAMMADRCHVGERRQMAIVARP